MNTIVPETTDLHAPAVGLSAEVAYEAVSNKKHAIFKIAFSYDASPTGGLLTISRGTDVVFRVSVPAAGLYSLDFSPAISSDVNEGLSVVLSSGGEAVTGAVSVIHKTIP